MEQPSDPHPSRLRCPPPSRNPRGRHPGVRRDVRQGPQGSPERLLPLFPAHIFGEPLQAPSDRP